MASTVILARHGQTDWNVQNRTQGHQEAPLNKLGRDQAHGLGQQLKVGHPPIDLIISSDLQRAAQTAEIVAEILGVAMHFDSRLRECGFGKLEGLTPDEILREHGEALRPAFEDYNYEYDFGPYEGESRVQVVARHTQVLDEIETATDFETVLLVGHGRSFNNVLQSHWPKPTVLAIRGNCEYQVLALPSQKQSANRAAPWAASPSGRATFKEIVEMSQAASKKRQEDERVDWESLHRPVDRFD